MFLAFHMTWFLMNILQLTNTVSATADSTSQWITNFATHSNSLVLFLFLISYLRFFLITCIQDCTGGRKILDLFCRFMLVWASLPVWKATPCHHWNPFPPPLPLVMPNCVLQHLFIIDGRHDGYGHNINVRLTQQRHESWPTLFQSQRFIGPPLKSDI